MCSQSCPGGNRQRSRRHTCGLKDQIESELCGYIQGFGLWGEWTACSRTCGGGQMSRVRRDICGIIEPEIEIK